MLFGRIVVSFRYSPFPYSILFYFPDINTYRKQENQQKKNKKQHHYIPKFLTGKGRTRYYESIKFGLQYKWLLINCILCDRFWYKKNTTAAVVSKRQKIFLQRIISLVFFLLRSGFTDSVPNAGFYIRS